MGEDAWIYIQKRTNINLKAILTAIASENIKQAQKNSLLSEKGANEVEKNIKSIVEGQ